MPEAGAVILLGVISGGLLRLFSSHGGSSGVSAPAQNPNCTVSAPSSDSDVASGLLHFSPNAFFLLLLPPIIFNSGYHMNRSLFFPLLPAISLYAVVGTLISCLVVGFGLNLAVKAGLTGGFEPR